MKTSIQPPPVFGKVYTIEFFKPFTKMVIHREILNLNNLLVAANLNR